MTEAQTTQAPEETDFLKIAREAYTGSTSYVDSSYRKRWEDNLRMFQGRHPADSKYNTEAFRYRSRLFRPKTRSAVRKTEAAAATAFFSNPDVVSVDPEDSGSSDGAASAALMKHLLQYRLTKSVPWFQIVMGGVQDAMTVGVVCSFQYWKYRDRVEHMPVAVDDGMGGQVEMYVPQRKVIEDKPCVELWPVENVRFDQGADWTDPINSSPYVIRMIPMYVRDVKAKIREGVFKDVTDQQMLTARSGAFDSTRQTREKDAQDRMDQTQAITEFSIVWVHENFVRIDDEDYQYFTLSTEALLSDPKPIAEVYFHGERPLVLGCAMIETHRVMPDAPVGIGGDLQREANDIVNQRLDNVKLILNKRYKVKRGKQVDLQSLVKNVAGSITLVNDMDDVQEIEFSDVTSSAYQEQDRVNADYDGLLGDFSVSSVNTNRKLGETVGGMAMISNAANQLTEYTLRTITETWLERVLRQLVKLEQHYETDEVVLALAGDRAKLQRFGVDQVTDELLGRELTLTVNVGMNATDPMLKLNKFVQGIRTYGEVAQTLPPGANLEEVGKEIFAIMGYKDGMRFLGDQNPNVMRLQEMLQQAQAVIEEQGRALASKQVQDKAKLEESAANVASKLRTTAADVNLKEAQTVKTLAEANRVPSDEMEAAAANV